MNLSMCSRPNEIIQPLDYLDVTIRHKKSINQKYLSSKQAIILVYKNLDRR